MSLLTFQDFEKSDDKMVFMVRAITAHELSPLCRTARDADLYDRQKNKTIYNYVQTIFSLTGQPIEDFTASNIFCNTNRSYIG